MARAVDIAPGQECTLRMEHHGTLWGFTCRALKVLTSPAPMLALARFVERMEGARLVLEQDG